MLLHALIPFRTLSLTHTRVRLDAPPSTLHRRDTHACLDLVTFHPLPITCFPLPFNPLRLLVPHPSFRRSRFFCSWCSCLHLRDPFAERSLPVVLCRRYAAAALSHGRRFVFIAVRSPPLPSPPSLCHFVSFHWLLSPERLGAARVSNPPV